MNYNTELQSNNEDLQRILNKINALPEAGGGVELPELTNPAIAGDIISGKEAIDANGNKITGTIPEKTESDLTASGATVTVPAGRYAAQTTKSVATATQATPSVSIDSSGKITSTATQSAGYVTAGTKTGTKQLTTQAAKTVTPTTSDQTAVESGRYTTGAVKVKGDSNLVPGNIKSGVSIFGVTGTHSGDENLSSELAEYTALNAELESVIDSLPSAGGSGGTSKKTVTITVTGQYYYYVCYIAEDGTAKRVTSEGETVEALGGALLKSTGNLYKFAVDSGQGLILGALDSTTGNVSINYSGSFAPSYDMCICTEDGSVVSVNRRDAGSIL